LPCADWRAACQRPAGCCRYGGRCERLLGSNSGSLQAPLRSPPPPQRHRGAVKSWPEDLGSPILFATDAARGEETGETHAERLARLKRQAQLDAEEDGGTAAAGKRAGKKQKEAQADRKRPGKRQRAELKKQREASKEGARKRPGKKQRLALKAATAAGPRAGNGAPAAARPGGDGGKKAQPQTPKSNGKAKGAPAGAGSASAGKAARRSRAKA
jgi:hypothetical protein